MGDGPVGDTYRLLKPASNGGKVEVGGKNQIWLLPQGMKGELSCIGRGTQLGGPVPCFMETN